MDLQHVAAFAQLGDLNLLLRGHNWRLTWPIVQTDRKNKNPKMCESVVLFGIENVGPATCRPAFARLGDLNLLPRGQNRRLTWPIVLMDLENKNLKI